MWINLDSAEGFHRLRRFTHLSGHRPSLWNMLGNPGSGVRFLQIADIASLNAAGDQINRDVPCYPCGMHKSCAHVLGEAVLETTDMRAHCRRQRIETVELIE